jgi:hypothetical protein
LGNKNFNPAEDIPARRCWHCLPVWRSGRVRNQCEGRWVSRYATGGRISQEVGIDHEWVAENLGKNDRRLLVVVIKMANNFK